MMIPGTLVVRVEITNEETGRTAYGFASATNGDCLEAAERAARHAVQTPLWHALAQPVEVKEAE